MQWCNCCLVGETTPTHRGERKSCNELPRCANLLRNVRNVDRPRLPRFCALDVVVVEAEACCPEVGAAVEEETREAVSSSLSEEDEKIIVKEKNVWKQKKCSEAMKWNKKMIGIKKKNANVD